MQRTEDEWKEFEEEERKDYTGLKISQLQITDDAQLNNAVDGDGYDKYDSDGELNTDFDKQKSGPWKKVADETSAPVPEVVAIQEKPTSNVYISPALRNAQVSIQKALIYEI